MVTSPHEWIQEIIASGMSKAEDFQGCSDAEIKEMEEHFRLSLPATYRSFLRAMGKSAGNEFLRDCIFTYPNILKFRDQADNLAKAGGVAIPKTAMVFLIHDYQFHYFDTSDDVQDPPTYRYVEEDENAVQIFDTFTGCMASILHTEIDAWQAVKSASPH